MADDEPLAEAPAEQQAPVAPVAEQEEAPAAAATEEEAAAAPAAPPPSLSTAKKLSTAAPASTKKKASTAAKPASAASASPASTPSRAGRERKKVDFFSPPQAVVKEDLVQVKVRFLLLLRLPTSTNPLSPSTRLQKLIFSSLLSPLMPSVSLSFLLNLTGQGH